MKFIKNMFHNDSQKELAELIKKTIKHELDRKNKSDYRIAKEAYLRGDPIKPISEKFIGISIECSPV